MIRVHALNAVNVLRRGVAASLVLDQQGGAILGSALGEQCLANCFKEGYAESDSCPSIILPGWSQNAGVSVIGGPRRGVTVLAIGHLCTAQPLELPNRICRVLSSQRTCCSNRTQGPPSRVGGWCSKVLRSVMSTHEYAWLRTTTLNTFSHALATTCFASF
jgi:hypothetical protein